MDVGDAGIPQQRAKPGNIFKRKLVPARFLENSSPRSDNKDNFAVPRREDMPQMADELCDGCPAQIARKCAREEAFMQLRKGQVASIWSSHHDGILLRARLY